MWSMQDKITDRVQEIARAAGLEAVETTRGIPADGLWWIQDGFDTRLVVEFSIRHAYADLTISGPAVDYAAETGSIASWAHHEPLTIDDHAGPARREILRLRDLLSQAGVGWVKDVTPSDGESYRLTLQYDEGDQFAAFFGLLEELLAPWTATKTVLDKLAGIREGLHAAENGAAAAEVSDAMAVLSGGRPSQLSEADEAAITGDLLRRHAAAEHLETAISLLPEGSGRGRLGPLADLLAVASPLL
jgi:hypothetical protein